MSWVFSIVQRYATTEHILTGDRTHENKHTRPFICEVSGCPRTNGFSTLGELQRHKRSHFQSLFPNEDESWSRRYFCPEPSCDRSSSNPNNKPFTRKDNRDDHNKRIHGNQVLQQASYLQRSPVSPSSAHPIPELIVSRRQSADVPEHPSASGSGKRKRVEVGEFPSEKSSCTNEACCSIRNEVIALKKRVRDLQDELRSSKEKEDTLFKIIRGGLDRAN
jgi:hypothetical protein